MFYSWRQLSALPALLVALPALVQAATVTYDFNITWVTANPDGQFDRPTIGINGAWPLPIITANVNDTIIVNVENQLGNQTTTLHFHGLYMNGTTHMDGPMQVSQCGIPDGHKFTYNFTITQPGTYWYHSHAKGQYPDGLRAPLIIHDPESPYKDEYDEEYVLSVSDWYHDQMQDLIPIFMNRANPTGAEPVPDSALFNDTQDLKVKMTPGKTYLFRVVNIGAFAGQYIWFEGHNMTIVEVDGVYTEKAEAELIYLSAAQRCSFLITAKNESSTNYAFVGSMDTSLFDAFSPDLDYNVTGWLTYDEKAAFPPAALLDDFDNEYDDFTLVPYDKQELYTNPDQSIALEVVMDNLDDGANYAFFNNITYTSPKVPTLYTVLSAGEHATNPAIYGEYSHPFVLAKDEVIEIIINNNDPGKHPFHLHGHAFQAVWRADEEEGYFNTTENPTTESELPATPVRRDTFVVRPNGNIVLRFKADNPGVWLFHCHIEWHVDSGLIATMVEAPAEMQKSLTIPADHFRVCDASKTHIKGNAAGNTMDLLDLSGQNQPPNPLPEGFTAKGIIAMTFSVLAAILGVAVISWYGLADMGAAEMENERRRITAVGGGYQLDQDSLYIFFLARMIPPPNSPPLNDPSLDEHLSFIVIDKLRLTSSATVYRATLARFTGRNNPDLCPNTSPFMLGCTTWARSDSSIFLEEGADIQAKDSSSLTPLSWAAQKGHKSIVKLLMEKGAEVDAEDRDFGQTPLFWALENGHEAVVKLLLEKGAKVDTKTYSGWTLLLFAKDNGDEAVVKLLMQKGAEVEAEDTEMAGRRYPGRHGAGAHNGAQPCVSVNGEAGYKGRPEHPIDVIGIQTSDSLETGAKTRGVHQEPNTFHNSSIRNMKPSVDVVARSSLSPQSRSTYCERWYREIRIQAASDSLENVSLRTIRPLVGDSSASASDPSQPTIESTSSDHRLIHYDDKGREPARLPSKRRRVPESITRNACLNCKKGRAKCDGNKPCSRCTTRAEMTPCVYEIHIKHAKEELMKQIHELRAKNNLNERVIKALQSGDKAPDILRALSSGDSLESIVQSLGSQPVEEQDHVSPEGSPTSIVGGSEHEPRTQIRSGFAWTIVTHESTVLDHLFQLYFAWVHPISTLFSEAHFVQSYKGQNSRHCSSQLVNAMCALACHLHTQSEESELDSDQLGIQFSEAFLTGFDPDDKSITSIQAAAVMFLVELGRGFGLRGSSYLRLATESIAELSASSNEELPCVLKKTVQGIRCLNVEWAQVTFQFPSVLGFRAVEDTHDEEAYLDDSPWHFYRYEDDQCPLWPGLLATTSREKMKLIDIIKDVSVIIYSPLSNFITARHVLEQYGRFIAWRTALPPTLGNAETSIQALPHILSLLILYDYSVVQLLCPLLDLEDVSPQLVEVVWTHAEHALLLLERHYRLHYTCRYQPALQMFAVLNICHVIARFFPAKPPNDSDIKDGSEAVTIGLEALQESNIGFPAAGALKELLRRSAAACSLRLPRSLDYLITQQRDACPTYSYHDFIDVCTRPSCHQPLWAVCEKFDSKFAEDWYSQSQELGHRLAHPIQQPPRELQGEPDRGVQHLMQVWSLLNTN
ncbi:hypothetical protein V490_00014 [Pseudogymnoascus sp. VKM F-3557]|nr:hypothetical protein V490_00014 [Pseudogymnoascus sp. VKM F-3557]